MDSFSFTPVNGYEDTDAYPNPSSGTQTRSQLMSIPKQIRDFLNNTLIPAVNGLTTSKQDKLTFDDAPTASSANPVKSGGVKTALDAKQDAINGSLTLTDLKLVVNGVTYAISVDNGVVTATPQV